MSDLISRQAAFIALNKRAENVSLKTRIGLLDAVRVIDELPSVEPERKKGKWIEGKKTPGYTKWNCSECGLLVRNSQKPWYEYCPNCGARMEVDG